MESQKSFGKRVTESTLLHSSETAVPNTKSIQPIFDQDRQNESQTVRKVAIVTFPVLAVGLSILAYFGLDPPNDTRTPQELFIEESSKPSPDSQVLAALAAKIAEELESKNPVKLKLLDWSCTSEHGYTTIEGRVKNVSAEPIADLEARGEFVANDNTFVKSDSALVDYRPLMPSQITTFKVLTSGNPLISKCELAFNEFNGGIVRYEK